HIAALRDKERRTSFSPTRRTLRRTIIGRREKSG
uniref:Uncharacterized protein n=1 Tax=Lutzomyia longipalpis TaxID=7200 RepID=A0A1B0CWP5_LUTLO